MKIHRLFRRSTAAVQFAVVLSLIPIGLTAQEKSKPASSEKASQPARGASPYALEVANGVLIVSGATDVRRKTEATLGNLVDALRERHPEANIALAPALMQVKIADLKLRAAELDSEIEAFRVATGNKFRWNRISAGADPQPQPGAAAVHFRSSLYMLEPNPEFFSARGQRTVEAFNLGGYFQQQGRSGEEIDEILGRIKEMIVGTLARLKQEDYTPADEPDFQFHSGANLFVVIGPPEAIDVARKVIGALPGQSGRAGGGGGGSLQSPYVPVASSKERRALAAKLESIRLDSVLYDALPLGEVVRNLVDEVKKRDPEKKGINFLVNPNASPVVAGPGPSVDPGTGLPIPNAAPPPELVDISSIQIRINPALSNVRLVDVLDAIVRVADHPIKYSVTDYAVVFSLAGNEGPMAGAPIPGIPPDAPPRR